MMADDLSLSELSNFIGTEEYHSLKPLFTTNVTDGVKYVMDNGYSWFVTDMVAVIETKLKGKDVFFSVKLKVKNKSAVATVEDGNGKIYHRQEYKYTDAKRDLVLYWDNGVLMVSGEY
jgi:hypothetical protein